jgi:hypothetical protein
MHLPLLGSNEFGVAQTTCQLVYAVFCGDRSGMQQLLQAINKRQTDSCLSQLLMFVCQRRRKAGHSVTAWVKEA